MSEDTPDDPQDPPPLREEPEPRPYGGGMWLGMLLGALALYALYFGTTTSIGPDQGSRPYFLGPIVFIPIGVYLAVAIFLAVRPRTSQWGAGLLIGLGVFTLLGGGICVLYLSQMRV